MAQQQSNIVEITGEASLIHIFSKQVPGQKYRQTIIDNGGSEDDVRNAAAYSIQVAIEKKSTNFDTLKAAVKQAGVRLSRETMGLQDGDKVLRKDGTPVAAGSWLLNARSKFPVSIYDDQGRELHKDEEPGDGTIATVAINVKPNGDKSRVNYYLTGVIIEQWMARPEQNYVFSRFRQDDTAQQQTATQGSEDDGMDQW